MSKLLWIFSALFVCGYLFTTSWAVEPPPSNEMEQLLKKIKHHTQAVGQATQAAHEVSEKMVKEKVAEKQELKEAVVMAEAKVEQMAVIQEVYVSKMMSVGLDTTVIVVDEGKLKGAIYDAFLQYQKDGGTEDFEYFRLYIYK
jgi:hypothetical protein